MAARRFRTRSKRASAINARSQRAAAGRRRTFGGQGEARHRQEAESMSAELPAMLHGAGLAETATDEWLRASPGATTDCGPDRRASAASGASAPSSSAPCRQSPSATAPNRRRPRRSSSAARASRELFLGRPCRDALRPADGKPLDASCASTISSTPPRRSPCPASCRRARRSPPRRSIAQKREGRRRDRPGPVACRMCSARPRRASICATPCCCRSRRAPRAPPSLPRAARSTSAPRARAARQGRRIST